MMAHPSSIPTADAQLGLEVLSAFWQGKSPLGALRVMRDHLGNIFQVTLPGFKPVFLSGPEYCRYLLVTGRKHFNWRTEADPVTRLLRHGLLVEDGESHDRLRTPMNDVLSGRHADSHIETFWRSTDAVARYWEDAGPVDMLAEMRKIALLIFMRALLAVNFEPDLERLWMPILRLLKYISPGLWILFPKMPRPGYSRDIRIIDVYLYDLIRHRRANPIDRSDLLTRLVNIPDFSDDLIRDQLLTMLIAGHDTSTALLAWTLYLLGSHPDAMNRASQEVAAALQGKPPTIEALSKLPYLEMVIKESLRLYPPIHVGNRQANCDVPLGKYTIPEGSRVMYSIYLTHRDPQHWVEPDRFHPERFDRTTGGKPAPFSYLPFGGGPRTCIGAAFAQAEALAVLARLLDTFELTLTGRSVRPHMGATLEPRPGVAMKAHRINQV
jgi:cytochrome P450